MRVPRAVLLGVATATVLSGCSPSGSGSDSDTAADRSASSASPSATGTNSDGPVPDEESASTDVPGEDSRGPESPDAGGAGGVTVSLPSLPIGGGESVSSGVGDTCITVSYTGNSEKQSIPLGVRIRVTEVDFSSNLLARGGDGCPPGGRSCLGGDAFTAEESNCGLPVRVTREPEGGQETVYVQMDGKADCATALEEHCADFARSLDGAPPQTVSVTVNGSSSPSPEESSPETAPESAPPTSGVPETSAGTSPKPSAGPATGAGRPSG